MRLKRLYVQNLLKHMEDDDVDEVELTETTDGKVKAYSVNTQVSLRPIKLTKTTTRTGSGEGETEESETQAQLEETRSWEDQSNGS